MAVQNETKMSFNVLIKKEENLFCIHCLELDIVTVSSDIDAGMKDLFDLIISQIEFAFVHNNFNNLFKSAPQKIWKEFYESNTALKAHLNVIRQEIPSAVKESLPKGVSLPDMIEAQTSLIEGDACFV